MRLFFTVQGLKSLVTYSIVGDNQAMTHFFIHPSDGVVYVRTPLTDDPTRAAEYQVHPLSFTTPL